MAPRTPTEETLAEIWSKILGLERVGVHDTFCDLGGHSLGAMRIIDEVRNSFDQKLSVELFFRNPTIEEMAKVLENEKQSIDEGRLIESSSCVVPIRPEGSTPPLFLIHGMGGTMLRLAKTKGEPGVREHHVEGRWHHRGVRSRRLGGAGDGGILMGRSSTAAGWNSWARACRRFRTTAKDNGSRSTRRWS